MTSFVCLPSVRLSMFLTFKYTRIAMQMTYAIEVYYGLTILYATENKVCRIYRSFTKKEQQQKFICIMVNEENCILCNEVYVTDVSLFQT